MRTSIARTTSKITSRGRSRCYYLVWSGRLPLCPARRRHGSLSSGEKGCESSFSLSRSLSVSSRAGIEVRALERAPKMALGLARRSLPDF